MDLHAAFFATWLSPLLAFICDTLNSNDFTLTRWIFCSDPWGMRTVHCALWSPLPLALTLIRYRHDSNIFRHKYSDIFCVHFINGKSIQCCNLNVKIPALCHLVSAVKCYGTYALYVSRRVFLFRWIFCNIVIKTCVNRRGLSNIIYLTKFIKTQWNVWIGVLHWLASRIVSSDDAKCCKAEMRIIIRLSITYFDYAWLLLIKKFRAIF